MAQQGGGNVSKMEGIAIKVRYQSILSHHRESRAYASKAVMCIDYMDYQQISIFYGSETDNAARVFKTFMLMVQESVGNKSVQQCSDLPFIPYCTAADMSFVRAVCGRYCGCD